MFWRRDDGEDDDMVTRTSPVSQLLGPPLTANLSSSHVGDLDWMLVQGSGLGPTWHLLREFKAGVEDPKCLKVFQYDIVFSEEKSAGEMKKCRLARVWETA